MRGQQDFTVTNDIDSWLSFMNSFDDDLSVSTIITEAVAEREGIEQTELPPLHEHVNVDAIDEIFHPISESGTRTGTVQFPYSGYIVTVEYGTGAAGTVDVEPKDSQRE